MPDALLAAPLPPGSTIGILGSGQLGRMLAMAAARLGLKTHIYCEESGPAFDVAAATTKAGFTDRAALTAFASAVDAVTYEFENVPVETARHLAGLVPLRPGAKALDVAQDRLTEKQFIAGLGIPVAPFRAVESAAGVEAALADLAAPAILKTRRFGYDGKGQVPLVPGGDARAAWEEIGGKPAVLEKRVAFAMELSALVVRDAAGGLVFYDCPKNTHEGGILRRSRVPARLPEADLARARDVAGTIAAALGYVGVLAVEMFHLGADTAPAGRLVVNEIAPRVHNSGHWTIDACAVSQFENHIRAVAGWPLGRTDRHSDAEMINLIGTEALAWRERAAEPNLCLHLYGKRDARPGRKMGHVTRLLPKS
ncbi:MAG TPA: 5-(carboxyamino)imidazole ribonucleotide synthase [Hyphomicrobiaceae bacterium]|jgi:5-(carboxyamino)imidazole ribonucleotide synthase|nr:5-(carboxyamino)imidazole ribonucleotide synthase [Hyphomicrobiaceae bacterium]